MTTFKNIYHWLYKYKIHHLLFWFIYHFIYWTVYEGNAWRVLQNLGDPYYFYKFTSFVIFQAIGVYFCLYYLIPKFLEKRKYFLFLVLVFITILSISIIISGGYAYAVTYNEDIQLTLELCKTFSLKHAIPSSIGSMSVGMSIKLTKNWLESQKKQQELEKEKLETELKFLKSQFNPHFLFNTINSIFVLIHKNQELASDSLAKFSDLLRYQLYECNEPQIPLNKELSYIESFIELEKLRQGSNFEIKTKIKNNNSSNLAIAPFILMPFLENAFKHVSKQSKQQNWIRLKIDVQENLFTFEIINSTDTKLNSSREAVDYSGLGLKNVERRLDLVYANKYELIIDQKEDLYAVHLEINLNNY